MAGLLPQQAPPQQAPPQQAPQMPQQAQKAPTQQKAPIPPEDGPPKKVQTGKQLAGGVYPADEAEVEKFAAGIIKTMHNDKTRDGLMKQLTSEKVPVVMRIGSVAASVITSMLQKVVKQTKRKPKKSLVLKAVNMVVKEAAKMAELAGQKSTPEERKQAAGIAGELIDKGMSAKPGDQQKGQPPGQPQQGQPPQQQQMSPQQGQQPQQTPPQQPPQRQQQPQQQMPPQQRGLLGGRR